MDGFGNDLYPLGSHHYSLGMDQDDGGDDFEILVWQGLEKRIGVPNIM